MTPLSALDGLPMGDGPMRGVEFAPDGLQFINPVTLAITLPATQVWPVDQQIPVSYRGATSVVSLAALDPSSQDAKFKLVHFSGYALLLATKGLSASLEALRHRLGGDAADRIASAVAERLALVRQKQLLGTGNPEGLVLDDLLTQYEAEVLKPRLDAAGTSCTASRLAIETLLSYERTFSLLYGDSRVGDANAKLAQLMEVASPLCMKEEYEICRDTHIIHRIYPTWLGMRRQFLLLGVQSAAHDLSSQYVTQCLNFELQFHSEATWDYGSGTGSKSTVDSTVPLRGNIFQSGALAIFGTAPLVNTQFEFTTKDCTVTNFRGGGTFSASNLTFKLGDGALSSSPTAVNDFKLDYVPGGTTEKYQLFCPGNPPRNYDSKPGENGWGLAFQATHPLVEILQGATNWNVSAGELFAQKSWSLVNQVVAETGSMKLYHRPL
jgi:hypothetical protein